jgi:hypothetical protein
VSMIWSRRSPLGASSFMGQHYCQPSKIVKRQSLSKRDRYPLGRMQRAAPRGFLGDHVQAASASASHAR